MAVKRIIIPVNMPNIEFVAESKSERKMIAWLLDHRMFSEKRVKKS